MKQQALLQRWLKMPKILYFIFVLGILIRFLNFPDNINFAYDQARDSFASLDILKGDFKIIGPPTTASDKIFHGALFYYILAPIYFFSGNSPEVAAAFLRILNASGVFLVFYIGSLVFNRSVGLISAFLFAISYEQSQYAIFFGHPSPAAISILIYYLGLALLIFKNNPYGLVISLIGLGLTIQFEDVNALLLLSFTAYLLFFYKKLKFLNLKIIILGLGGFLITISSFILVELKYNFRTIDAIIDTAQSFDSGSSVNLSYVFSVIQRLIHDNFFANDLAANFLIILFLLTFIFLAYIKKFRNIDFFLGFWFLGGLLPHFLATKFSYYYSPGATVSLLILVSFLIFSRSLPRIIVRGSNTILFGLIIAVITFSNLNLILNQNSKGVNSDFVIQPGMILGNQKKALDYIYGEASGEPFAVNALTVPLNVKTTWDFLFNWYGKEKYKSIPVWYGNVAEGFYGELPKISSRSDVPKSQFLIIEPTVGIDEAVVNNFLKEENYFTKVMSEKTFGTIIVQKREKY